MAKNVAALLLSFGLSVVLFEASIRLFIQPSPHGWGTLLGRVVPPLRLPPAAPGPGASAPWRPGDAITWADLQGHFRDDATLGYAPQEHAISPNRWWVTNNIGARASVDTAPLPSAGRRRILVFGESFASGSRVRQDEAWPAVAAAGDPALELVGLAVDGYGMGQSLLRFRAVTANMDYDTAVLVLVPSVDLWREVNTIRSLAKPTWNSYTVMPRFVLEDGRLTLAASPYATSRENYAANAEGMSDRLRRHLRSYDRFYFRTLYESPSGLGRCVLYKIAATIYAARARDRLLDAMGERWIDPTSEALQVTQAIVSTFRDEVAARGRRFRLVILPDSDTLRRLRRHHDYADDWRHMVERLCENPTRCLDLTPTLASLADAAIDRGYDGTHYGPATNRVIAAAFRAGIIAESAEAVSRAPSFR